MSNHLKIYDVVKFSLTDNNLIKVRDDYAGAFKPAKSGESHSSGMGLNATPPAQSSNGLLVRIAATHSGIITRNNGFYLPDRMKKGATSWTDNFQKPVLVHHKDREDGIGRIVASEYVDTSGALQDSFDLKKGISVKDRHGKEKGVINDILIQDFCDGKMPFGMQVDTVVGLLRDSILEDSGYQGLGHIQILANITDRAAIEKLLDGRYLTGSVGAITDRAVCSVCRSDWTENGPCEHKPGGVYDGAKCFLIAGDLSYEEYSFVNSPADRHSKVLELHYNGIHDSIEIVNDYNGRIYEAQLRFPQFDSVTKEESVMAEKSDKAPVALAAEIKDSAQSVSAPESNESNETQVVDTALTADAQAVETIVEEGTVETTTSDNVTMESDTSIKDVKSCGSKKKKKKMKDGSEVEEDFDTFISRMLDGIEVDDEDSEFLYELMCDELEEAVKDGELDVELEDAKLSTEKRKKLTKTSFCGPNRSFPVPDCAHVTAARRLINRYKGPGSKDAILTCVNRKAKALGCDTKDSVKKKDSVVATETKTETEVVSDNRSHSQLLRIVLAALEEDKYYSQEPVLNDDEVKALQSILKRMASLVTTDSFVKALVAENLAVAPECERALIDEVVNNETLIGTLREELSALRKEYTNLFHDMEVLQDTLVERNVQIRQVQENLVSNLLTLRDGKVELDFSKLSDTELGQQVEKLNVEVDMKKIVDKLGDGMSREPTEKVDDLTIIRDNMTEQKSASPSELAKIQEYTYQLLFSGRKAEAEAFIWRMQQEGKLPKGN